MNVNAIKTNLAGVRFGSHRPEAPEGYEWAKDDGCPEGGLYLRQIDKDTVQISTRPEGKRVFFTDDNRAVFLDK